MSMNKMKWLFTMVFAALILALSAAGGNWRVSLAGSQLPAPTIPVVQAIDYEKPVYEGRPDLLVTITGSQFIDPTNTKVRWVGPDGTTVELAPFLVSQDGTQLKVIIPQNYLVKYGIAKISVINHPGTGEMGVSPNYEMQIWLKIYFPVMARFTRP